MSARIFICTGAGRLEANLQMADYLPEHVIVRILERLPIKSLIRFTCVSKRWRFIILFDPEFAKSQFQISSEQQTHRRVLVRSPSDRDEYESLDLEAPSSSSVRKVSCPFKQPGRHVSILCSCNGLVFAKNQQNNMYIWNPSTGFFKKLPNPSVVRSKIHRLHCYGFGYLSATDDYKLLAKLVAFAANDFVDLSDADDDDDDEEQEEEDGSKIHIFSSKANIWKRIEPPHFINFEDKGTLSNEALHWLYHYAFDLSNGILAFDLSNEEFRRMPLPLPDYHYDGEYSIHLGAFGDCLCAFDPANFIAGSIDLWVMREYGVADSWTKLFNLRVSNPPEKLFWWRPILVMETSTFLWKWTSSNDGKLVFDLIRSSHTAEKRETQMVRRNTLLQGMIDFEESLRWLAAP